MSEHGLVVSDVCFFTLHLCLALMLQAQWILCKSILLCGVFLIDLAGDGVPQYLLPFLSLPWSAYISFPLWFGISDKCFGNMSWEEYYFLMFKSQTVDSLKMLMFSQLGWSLHICLYLFALVLNLKIQTQFSRFCLTLHSKEIRKSNIVEKSFLAYPFSKDIPPLPLCESFSAWVFSGSGNKNVGEKGSRKCVRRVLGSRFGKCLAKRWPMCECAGNPEGSFWGASERPYRSTSKLPFRDTASQGLCVYSITPYLLGLH